ncbi:MAG: dTMP kinase [Thaumarchaeota archaeon]|nr:MAG: dTMP kinase [Nitrososphaerota archaeon]
MASGLLISLEGVDGAGKTTIARRLVRWLRGRGVEARYTREPTGGPYGRLLRRLAHGRRVDPRVEALLFAADRLYHLERIVEPLLGEGYVVVSDRYLHSSLAYQGASVGDLGWVEELNRFARRPDLGILLDVRPEVGLGRLRGRRSRFEREEFLGRVREVYLRYVDRGDLLRVDAEKPLEEVFSEVAGIVEDLLGLA